MRALDLVHDRLLLVLLSLLLRLLVLLGVAVVAVAVVVVAVAAAGLEFPEVVDDIGAEREEDGSRSNL